MEYDKLYDEIDNLWPKPRAHLWRTEEKKAFEKFVKDEDDFNRLKNAVEILLEDKPNKLPKLCLFIEKVFASNKPSAITSEPQPVAEYKSSVQLPVQGSREAENSFSTIYECWPTVLDRVESRSRALAAFLAACRTETPENIQKACQAYSDSFNAMEGMIYPTLLRNFLAEPETIEEWLAKFNNKTGFNDFVKQQFEAAYAWYPEFASKATEKTKKASLVIWYRCIPKDERLDFMLSCKYYAEQRKNMAADFDQSMDEEVTFTKSFNTFVGDWKSLVDKHQAAFVKRDFISKDVKLLALENDVDLTNLYGGGMWEDFFSEKAFPCFLMRCPTIKDAIKAMLEKTHEYVADMVAGKNKSILDKELAIRQTGAMDVEKVTEAIFSKIVETKSIILPRSKVGA